MRSGFGMLRVPGCFEGSLHGRSQGVFLCTVKVCDLGFRSPSHEMLPLTHKSRFQSQGNKP